MEQAPADSTAAAYDAADQRPAFGAEEQGLFEEAIRVLNERGHRSLVQRVFLILDQRQLGEAMRVLNDDGDHNEEDQEQHEHYAWTAWDPYTTLYDFRALLTANVGRMLNAGYDEQETFHVFHQLVLMAARETAGF
ncbi:unnamed protein product [Urochloa humidicola]